MIHLDTNYLVRLLLPGSAQAILVDQWPAAGELLAVNAVAWSEFLNGPVTTTGISRLEIIIESRIIPFGRDEALVAANLFNQTGRRRGFRFDCLIAASAILSRAELATANESDFKPFTAFGLKLK